MPTPRTVEQLRQQALERYTRVASEEETRLGLQLLDDVLALEVDQLLDLKAWLARHAPEDTQKSLAVSALMLLVGALDLLELETTHEMLGLLPPVEVTKMYRAGDKPHHYRDVVLTPKTVLVQFRRKPL